MNVGLSELANMSKLKADDEIRIGFTCQEDVGSGEGPRQDLRLMDQEKAERYYALSVKSNSALEAILGRLYTLRMSSTPTSNKQILIDELTREINYQRTEALFIGQQAKSYLTDRIDKGQNGWWGTTSTGKSIYAYCHDTAFDDLAADIISAVNRINNTQPLQTLMLLDLGSDPTASTIDHLTDAVFDGSIQLNPEFYAWSFGLALLMDALGLSFVLFLPNLSNRQCLISYSEICKYYDSGSKSISIPLTETSLLTRAIILSEPGLGFLTDSGIADLNAVKVHRFDDVNIIEFNDK